MSCLTTHLRNKFLAGALATGPIVVLILGAMWIEEHTRILTQPLGFHFPGLGFLIALGLIYLLGLIVTSLLGRYFLHLADRALSFIPGLNLLYRAWKEVLLIPPGGASMYEQVVLVPNPDGPGVQLGFTNAKALPGDAGSICVFLPGVPNPLTGQLVLVPRDVCLVLPLGIEEAFKFLLSSGNYLPDCLQGRVLGAQSQAAADQPSNSRAR